MQFSDIHIHALCGCDDGAKTTEDMCKMIDFAYDDGTRYICFTPHYNPGYFGENYKNSIESFEIVQDYVKEKYPDLKLALGNEIRYNPGCENWLTDGKCRSMNDTKYILIDFFEEEDRETIRDGLNKILNTGFIPILAHAERYNKIKGNLKFLNELRDNGVLIQIDTKSIFGDFGYAIKMFCKKIIKNRLVDFVSSDAHDLVTRTPGIKKAYEFISKKNGNEYAEDICCKNVSRMIFGQWEENNNG